MFLILWWVFLHHTGVCAHHFEDHLFEWHFSVHFIHTAVEPSEFFIYLTFQLIPANLKSVQSTNFLHGLFKCLLGSQNLVLTACSWMPCSSPLSLNLLYKPAGPPGSQQVLWSCQTARGIVLVLHGVDTEDLQRNGFHFKACFCCLHVFSSLPAVDFGIIYPAPNPVGFTCLQN